MLREQLAELAHKQWSGWMKYMFENSTMDRQGNCVIPRDLYKRWCRQMNTEFKDLLGHEQDSNRTEADKVIDLVKQWIRMNIDLEVTYPGG